MLRAFNESAIMPKPYHGRRSVRIWQRDGWFTTARTHARSACAGVAVCRCAAII